jgi:hypothetical protein
MKPVFVLGYLGCKHFVDPANANFAMVSPPLYRVDVRKIRPGVADGYEYFILPTKLNLLDP